MGVQELNIEEAAGYVCKYAPLYNIRVHSPIIAQIILESAKGTSNKVYYNGDWRHNYLGLKWRANRCPVALGWFTETGSEQDPNTLQYITDDMKWFRFRNLEECVIGYFQFTDIPHYSSIKGVTDPETYLQRIKDCGYASSVDYVKNVMRVIRDYDLTKYDDPEVETMKTVFLSAGHGGSDPGAVAFGMQEKNINLQIMLACKEILEDHGLNVVCSRLKDENDPVTEEVKEANASGADLAASFHINAGGGDGFEVFYHTTNADGKRLCDLAIKYVQELGQNSRGAKSGNHLHFIKNTNMTAVLFESFFLDNDLDNNIGDTVAEQNAFGAAYAKAILEYFGIQYKESTGSAPELSTESTTPETTPEESKLYRVQCGAFRFAENAEALAKQLEKAGFATYIVRN